MLKQILDDASFGEVMQHNIVSVLHYLFENNQDFGVLCKLEFVTFEPPLPKHISKDFRNMTLFYLAGYTFDSATLDNNTLSFEAGFGEENFGSLVSVALGSIVQIIVDDSPILINQFNYKKQKIKKEIKQNGGIENSMSTFLSNPENARFLKK